MRDNDAGVVWGDKFKKYFDKVKQGYYLKIHILDDRNQDPVDDKIRLDKDSRECIMYLHAMIDMVHELRENFGVKDA